MSRRLLLVAVAALGAVWLTANALSGEHAGGGPLAYLNGLRDDLGAALADARAAAAARTAAVRSELRTALGEDDHPPTSAPPPSDQKASTL